MERIIKIICVIVLIFSNSLMSFAAVVSDNNGAAFITKAEFDSLKNEFQATINQYNQGIDNKIDGAIALYLAGASTDEMYTVDTNITTLNYPLTIWNKRSMIENVVTDSSTLAGATPLWAPGWYFLAACFRDSLEILQIDKWNNVDRINYYFNGTADTSNGTFKVKNILCNPVMNFTTAFHHENLKAADSIYTSLILDCYQNVTKGSAWNSGSPWTRRYVRPNYYINTKASEYVPLILGLHHPGGQITWKGSGQATYDTLTSGNTTWELHAAGPFNADTMMTKEAYHYSTKQIDMIYNYGDSTHTTHFAPTTQDGELYITNKKSNRTWNNPNYKIAWNTQRQGQGTSTGLQGILSEGINLEHENEDKTRAWNLKALISQDRLIYDFETLNGSIISNHKMVEGIPIFEYKNGDGGKHIKDIIVDFSLTSNVPSNQKYIILSTNPITTQVYSDDVESNANYITIKSLNGVSKNVKKLPVSDGSVKVKIDGEMNSGEVLYLKVLFNDASEESVSITKPRIQYTETSTN